MEVGDSYIGREQTLVKHFILRSYLSRFAPIVLKNWNSISYVDCFSGPWNAHNNDLSDTSFAIALDELRKARDQYKSRGREVEIRCFFLERDKEAYAKLKAFADDVVDARVETKNAILEDSVEAIADFVRRGGRQTFPFTFIDPTGWTGFAMSTITPLLRMEPGEVLINLMTKDVRRFIESPEEETQASFDELFGRTGVKQRVAGLRGLERDDAVVAEYGASVRAFGAFTYVCSAIVLHPERDRTHFHLVYGTRHRKGVEVFKDAEKKAMATQETARAAAQERRRQQSTGMASLFGDTAPDSAHYNRLRRHYIDRSSSLVRGILEQKRRVPYEEIWDVAMAQPMTWESDLKDWLRRWQGEGLIAHEGWAPRQKVPHLDERNVVVWL
jgi:three-Cys-motif partner protein